MSTPEEADATPDEAFDIGRIRGYDEGWAEGRAAALKEAEETVSALLADPTIYASAAVVGVISAQTAVHALRSSVEGEQP
jgi:hypothetical protein